MYMYVYIYSVYIHVAKKWFDQVMSTIITQGGTYIAARHQ